MDAMRKIHKQNEAVFQIMKTELEVLTHVNRINEVVNERLRILGKPARKTSFGGKREGAKGYHS